MTKKMIKQQQMVDDIYSLGLIDLIDEDTCKIYIDDSPWEWMISKQVWKDGFFEIHISQSNHKYIFEQKLKKSEILRQMCRNSCFVYKDTNYTYDTQRTIKRDGLVFQDFNINLKW